MSLVSDFSVSAGVFGRGVGIVGKGLVVITGWLFIVTRCQIGLIRTAVKFGNIK